MTALLALAACEQPDPVELSEGSTSDRALPSGLPRLEPRRDEILAANCWVTYDDGRGGTMRYLVDADGHPVTGRHGDYFRRWERRYEPDGDLAEIAVHWSPQGWEEVWRYTDGRLTEGHDGSWRWDEEGRLIAASRTDYRWEGAWDADGHLLGEAELWYGSVFPSTTHWRWDGDRILGYEARSSSGFPSSAEWDAWEGDRPVHGKLLNEKSWEERWEWDGDRPTLHTSTKGGSERVVGAWSWDGERLLEVERPEQGVREVWTWDDEGHLVSVEGEYDGDRYLWTFAWDGDLLLETTDTGPDGETATTAWSGRCPQELRARYVPSEWDWQKYETPFPSVHEHLPLDNEPW